MTCKAITFRFLGGDLGGFCVFCCSVFCFFGVLILVGFFGLVFFYSMT